MRLETRRYGAWLRSSGGSFAGRQTSSRMHSTSSRECSSWAKMLACLSTQAIQLVSCSFIVWNMPRFSTLFAMAQTGFNSVPSRDFARSRKSACPTRNALSLVMPRASLDRSPLFNRSLMPFLAFKVTGPKNDLDVGRRVVGVDFAKGTICATAFDSSMRSDDKRLSGVAAPGGPMPGHSLDAETRFHRRKVVQVHGANVSVEFVFGIIDSHEYCRRRADCGSFPAVPHF